MESKDQIEEQKGVKFEDDDNDDVNAEEEAAFDKEDLQCRFYRNEWPETEELVAVQIHDVNQDGAYVRLLEYNNRDALILASNTTRKRVKNVKKLLRLGTQDYMQVIAVDKEGGFIDLQKRTLQMSDVEVKKKEFDKAKVVHLILRLTAHNMQCKLIDLYEAYAWDLYDKFDHAYDAFKLCLTDPELVFSKITITDDQKKHLLANINKKMAAAPQKIRTTFNLHCYTYEGIDAIRDAMLAAKAKCSDEQFQIGYSMEAPPLYKAEVISLDKHTAIERLNQSLEIIQKEIKERGGQFKLVQAPTRIGSKNDGIENEEILANLAKNEDEESSNEDEEEDQTEGMDIDLENDDIAAAEDEDDN